MDWFARSCWTTSPNPDLAKAKRYGIWYVFVDPRLGSAADDIAKIREAGLYPGAYFSDSWWDVPAAEFARVVSLNLNYLLPRQGTDEAPPAMLDIETKNTLWAREAIAAYRSRQPRRPTAYTNAPFQGDFVPYGALRKAGMPFFVQLYYGPSPEDPQDMRPCDHARAVLEASRYYAPNLVHPFYDGALFSWDQYDGCQFTLERMP